MTAAFFAFALLSASAHAVTMPADVKKLEAQVQKCNAMAANPPTDEKKLLELEAKMKKAGCEDIEAQEKKLRWKYRNRLKILDMIEKVTQEDTADDTPEAEEPAKI